MGPKTGTSLEGKQILSMHCNGHINSVVFLKQLNNSDSCLLVCLCASLNSLDFPCSAEFGLV